MVPGLETARCRVCCRHGKSIPLAWRSINLLAGNGPAGGRGSILIELSAAGRRFVNEHPIGFQQCSKCRPGTAIRPLRPPAPCVRNGRSGSVRTPGWGGHNRHRPTAAAASSLSCRPHSAGHIQQRSTCRTGENARYACASSSRDRWSRSIPAGSPRARTAPAAIAAPGRCDRPWSRRHRSAAPS